MALSLSQMSPLNRYTIHFVVSSEFWKEVLSWLKGNNIVIESFNEIGLFLGIFEESEDFFLINHVMLLGKYYIYVRKCLGSLPSLREFKKLRRRRRGQRRLKNEFIFYLRISGYSQVIYFVYHCQSYRETESETPQ